MRRVCVNWSPVIVRGALWIAIAVLTTFLDKTADLTPDKLALWTWLDFLRLLVSMLISGLIVWRTFLDQTVARHAEKLKGSNETKTVVVAAPGNPVP